MKRVLNKIRQKLVNRYVRPRFSFIHVQLFFISGITAGTVVGLSVLTNEVIIPRLFAASSPWTQTDWSGGETTGLVTGTVTTYAYESDIDTTTSSGQFSLDETTGWSNDYSNWQYRKKVTFDNTDSNLGTTSENLVDFPVLIKLESGSDIDYSKTKDSGEDIRFTDSDGTVLSYEIEDWNESGDSFVWVKVPQINIDSDTDFIYMYYGNTSASDGQNASGVWNSDFLGVWHMNETSGTSYDSTSNSIDLTPRNSVTQSETGIIDGGDDFTGNGDALHNTSVNFSLNSTLSLEGWFKRSGSGAGSGRILEFSSAGDAASHALAVDSDGSLRAWMECSTGRVASTDDSTQYGTGNWYHYVYTYNGSIGRLYVNGSQTKTANGSCSNLDDIGDVIIGAISDQSGQYSLPQHEFDGDLDEHRASTAVFSPAWIAASYKVGTDSYNTFSAEESHYPSTGTITSNTLDAGFQSDWGDLTYSVSGSGTTTVKVRTDSSSDMSGATAWESCTGISSGTDLTSTSCVSDMDQYIEYQVTLEPDGGSTPVFEDISIEFSASDIIVPPTNATNLSISGVADGAWTNTEPTISWTAGADNNGGSGILGYCIALDEADQGSSSSLDPASTAGNLLNALDDGVTQEYCDFIASGTSLDFSSISGLTLTSGKQYYISIKAVDLAGNIWTGASGSYQDLLSFKYDNTPPSNPTYFSLPGDFISTKSATLIWPTTDGQASDSHSGVAGLQYRIGSGGTWYGDSHTGTEDLTDLLVDDGSYVFTQTPDFANISEGSNIVYLRTLDAVGNVSSSYVSGALKVNTESPSTPQNLTVDPTTNTSNSFAFDWSAPSTYTGQIENITYCYTVNALPTSINCTWTDAGTTSLSADSFANQPGENTFYLVARDEAGNVNYDTYASTTFTADTSAPGIPQNIDVADVSVKATSSWKLAVAWEEPASVGAGVEDYEIYHSTDGSTFSQESTVTGISYVDTSLSQTTHYYKVRACDSANNCGAFTEISSLYPDGKFTTPPSLSSGPTVSDITTKQAKISWGTNRAGDSKISYGKSSGDYFTEEPSNPIQTTDHTINLTNLSPGTTYHYKAKWTDEDGNTGESDEKSFTTDPAPTVKNVEISEVGISSAYINFTVTGASKVKVFYGESTSFGGIKEISTSKSESTYSIQLTGLLDGTKYFYKINGFDSEDDEYEGTTLDFETLPRPKVSEVRLQQVGGTAQPTVLVTWNTNTPVSSIVTYYPTGDTGSSRDEVNVALKTGLHRMILSGLLPNTPYSLIVKGRDRVGNEAISDVQSFTTATDTRPPQISNLKVEGAMIPNSSDQGQGQTSQLVVSWDTDEAATSQVEFGEGTGSSYAQKTQEDSNLTFNHLVVISNLSPSKVYHLRTLSKDSVGNGQSSIDVVTVTPKATENALDLVIGNFSEVFSFLRR